MLINTYLLDISYQVYIHIIYVRIYEIYKLSENDVLDVVFPLGFYHKKYDLNCSHLNARNTMDFFVLDIL